MHRLWLGILVVLFSAVWSSAFIAGAIALADFDPFTLLVVRFLISSVLLLPFCLASSALTFNYDLVAYGLTLGALNNAIYLGLSFSALRTIRPEVIIVVVSCAPFVTALFAAVFRVEELKANILVGSALGLIGVVIISGILSADRPDLLGLTFAFAGMCSFAAGTVLFKAREFPVLQVNFWQSIAGAVLLLPVALVFGQMPSAPSGASIAALLHLAIVVTIGGMALWLVLIRTSGAGAASSYHLLNPFFGVLLAHLILSEPLRSSDFVGVALIAVGLIVTTRTHQRMAKR